mgnify:CR=1 FL=1
MELTLDEIASRLGVRRIGDGAVRIRGVAGLREAKAGDITFLANPRYESLLRETRASAVIMAETGPATSLPCLVASDPYLCFARVLELFHPGELDPPVGIDPSAQIAPDATLAPGISVAAHAVIESRVSIGPDCRIGAGCFVGAGAVLGSGCVLHPHVVIGERCRVGDRVVLHAGVVIGADGFGYAFDGQAQRKIPQVGIVVIEDDVEIGANSTVDRATLGATRIGRGAKLDNLVHVAHNVEIGEHAVLCAQVGISGSTRLGRFVVLGGQAGLGGHIELGDGVRVGAQSGVTKSVPAGTTVSGYPAMLHAKAQRIYAALRHLPEALRSWRELERRVARLEDPTGSERREGDG